MKALVTGGAGFIGSHLAELLIDSGIEVTVLDNLTNGRMENLQHIDQTHLTFVKADITDLEQIKPHFNECDWVFHLAGMADIVPSIEQPENYFNTNVQGTFNVMQCARFAGVKKVVYAASSSCYGIPDSYPTNENAAIRPMYPYALTKYMGEELVLHWGQTYGIDVVSLRLFNIYGPRSRTTGAYGAVFGVFLAQKLNHKPFTVVGDGTQSRDFTYVTDVVRAFLNAAQDPDLGAEILNIGSGNHYSINQLIGYLGDKDAKITYIPKRPGEPDITFADIAKIQQKLHWKAEVSFEQGVKNMLSVINDWQTAPVWTEKGIQSATKSWFKYLS